MPTLYLVATPIGNLDDISFRALDVLRSVSLVAAEDTRHTGRLLTHFSIKTPMRSYYEHNKYLRVGQILEALQEGDVALVSDAGTPALNDPGYELVRAALSAGHQVSPIPGPCAPLAALVASGLPTDSFVYLGYLPRKPAERRRSLEQVASLPYTLIFLETPHRLLGSLQDLYNLLGDRQIAVARELTKLHEEIFRGTFSQAHSYFSAHQPRGEFTLVVAGFTTSLQIWDEPRLKNALREGLAAGQAASHLAGELAGLSGWPRRLIYQMILDLQAQNPEL
jgi:16S rRNA (cytidine1402-2'-O)-methyltransferase